MFRFINSAKECKLQSDINFTQKCCTGNCMKINVLKTNILLLVKLTAYILITMLVMYLS